MSTVGSEFPTVAPQAVAAVSSALESIRALLAARPNWAPAHFALGQELGRRGETVPAIAAYERVIEIKPYCVEAFQALAALLARVGRLAEARRRYEQAAALAPANHEIQNNLGTVLQELGEPAGAIACYERALAISPECLEAQVNLSAARLKLRQFEAAAAGLEQAAKRHPHSAEIQNRLGHALVPLGRLAEAREHYNVAIQLQPERALWRLRRDLLCPAVFASNAEIDEYHASLSERLSAYQDERLRFDVNELPSSNCHPPPELIYHGRDDLALRRKLASIFERSVPKNDPPAPAAGPPRLAFFVTKGSEGIFLRGMTGVLARLTPGRFRTTVVCAPSGVAKFKAIPGNAAIEYLPLSPTLGETIANVRAQRFDLAYHWEVGTDSLSYFLPFFRLAGAQCTSWGWPVTSGIEAMDFYLSSELLEPPDADGHYSERLVRLDHIPNFYSQPAEPPPQPDRERFSISPGEYVYVCPQNPAKIQPDFDALAGEILRRDRRGILLLVEARWPFVTKAIRQRFTTAFPDCADRFRYVPRMVHGEYLKLLATADVVLDTVHYGGGANSIYDALAVGTPVVTLPGRFHRGRYALAAYRAMGMTACTARSAGQYVEMAVQLATDPDHRHAVCNEIAATRGALFDNPAAVREFEDLIEQLALDGRRRAML